MKLLQFLTFASSLQNLNLSRNLLGFKTGAYLMNLLVDPQVKASTHIRVCDLSYNTISTLLQNSINKLLDETDFAMQAKLEATSTF
jgi:hypothetical protein